MAGTAYDKASRLVAELQRQLKSHNNPDGFLKKISEFLESQSDQTLKKIGEKMRSQMTDQSKRNN